MFKALQEGINQPEPETRRSILLGSFSQRSIEMLGYGSFYAQCFECTRHCPVCIQARTLKAKKLSPDATSKKPINKEVQPNV